MQYCAFRQSSFREVSLVLKVNCDTSVAHFSTVERNSHPSYTVIFGQEIDSFLTALKFIDYKKPLTYLSRWNPNSHRDTLGQGGNPGTPRWFLASQICSEKQCFFVYQSLYLLVFTFSDSWDLDFGLKVSIQFL